MEIYDLNIRLYQIREETIEKLKLINDQFTNLTDTISSSTRYDSIRTARSYKKVAAKEDTNLLKMLEQYLSVYLLGAKAIELLPESKISEKIDAMESYTHPLISEGEISTDVFKKECR